MTEFGSLQLFVGCMLHRVEFLFFPWFQVYLHLRGIWLILMVNILLVGNLFNLLLELVEESLVADNSRLGFYQRLFPCFIKRSLFSLSRL